MEQTTDNSKALEVSFKLERPIVELTPSEIRFNKEALIAGVTVMCEPYQNAIYDESQITALKDSLARLRRLDASLDDARKNAQKAYNKPFEDFKAGIEEVRAIIKSAISQLDEQAKAFEQKRIDEKTEQIKACWEEVVGEYKDYVSLDRVFDSRWLNKTVTLKQVRKDMEDIIATIAQNLGTIKALNSEDEAQLVALYFRTLSLDAALRENERLKADKARAKAFSEKPAKEMPKTPQDAPQAVTEPIPQQNETLYNVTLQFVNMTEEQALGLLEYIKVHNLRFRRLK